MALEVRHSSNNNYLNTLLNPIPPCQGVDDLSHRVFLVTNEDDQGKTLNTLGKEPVTGNTMIGISGFFNLNAFAARGSTCSENQGSLEYLILIDNGLRVEHFWREMEKIITTSSDRKEVYRKTLILLVTQKDRYFKGSRRVSPEDLVVHAQKGLISEMVKGFSWLSSDEQFDKIKRLFDSHCFAFKRMDLRDAGAFRALGSLLKENGHTVDSIYLSNAIEYLEDESNPQEEKRNFFQSVESVIGSKTLVIHTCPRGCREHDPLRQVIHRKNKDKVENLFPLLPPQCRNRDRTAPMGRITILFQKIAIDDSEQKDPPGKDDLNTDKKA